MNMTLQQCGLTKEQVAKMTSRMKPVATIIQERKRIKYDPKPSANAVVRNAIDAYLRKRRGEWLDSGQVAAGVGIQATLAGNILSAMVRGAAAIEKRIAPSRKPEYRWMGGSAA